jgi:hypothetical protein
MLVANQRNALSMFALHHEVDSVEWSPLILRGETMANVTNALQQLRAERSRAQTEVEKLDQAISVIESLNGLGVSR